MTKNDKVPTETEPILEIMQESEQTSESNEEPIVDASLEKTIELYRKIREQKGPLSEKELALLDQECDIIRKREIIANDIIHEIKELEIEG